MKKTSLNILHISDLHFTKFYEHKIALLLQPFLNDIPNIVGQFGRPDFIIFSGDLVQDPTEPDIYYHLLDYIEEISKTTSVPLDRFIVCPGNHDVNLRLLEADLSMQYDSISRNRHDQNYIEHHYRKGDIGEYLKKINGAFFTFCDAIGMEWDDPFVWFKEFPDYGLHIVAMNSTLGCGLGGSKKDRGNLIYPRGALEKCFAKIDPADFVLTTMHHPVDDLTESSSRVAKPLLQKFSNGHFYGHLHNPLPSLVSIPSTSTLFSQSGALYSTDYFKGYSLASWDAERQYLRQVYRSYFEEHRLEFDKALNVAPEGIFYPTPESKKYWHSVLPAIDRDKMRSWLRSDYEPAVTNCLDKTFGDHALADVFVFPPLVEYVGKSGANSDEAIDANRRNWDSTRICETPNNLVIRIPEESGATSLLQFLQLEICKRTPKDTLPLVPLYVDIRSLRPYLAHVEKALKAAHLLSSDESFGWSKLRVEQPYAILIDNFRLGNDDHKKIVEIAHQILPNARFILAARTVFADTSVFNIGAELPFSYSSLALVPYTRTRVRELVRNWKLPTLFTENAVVDDIVTKFQQLDIPLTGPHISMFLMVLSAQKKFAPLNASTIIENFVEELLDKPNVEKIFRSAFDFRESQGVLCEVAKAFVKGEVTGLPHEDINSIVADYYRKIGIRRDAVEVVQQFINMKIFEKIDGSLSFKYNVVYSYFVALAMSLSKEFREFVMDEGRFTSFVHELDLYCGISRNNEEILEEVSAYFDKIDKELPNDVTELMDISLTENIELPHLKEFDEFVGAFTRNITRELSQDERDKAIEPAGQSPEHFKQRLSRTAIKNDFLKWILALRAYSVCIKNLELIPHTVKERHLRICMRQWARLTSFAVAVVGTCFERREVKFAGITIVVDGMSKVDGRTMRLILTNVPRLVGQFVRSDLASDKLELQLKSNDLADGKLEDLLRTGLLAYLKDSEFMEYSRRYLKKVTGSEFLTQSLAWQLRDVYLRYGFSGTEADEFKKMIAEIDADWRGKKGLERERHITAVINSLGREKLVAELRQ